MARLSFESNSSKYKDVSLEDGKSSEALLAALKGYSSNTMKEFEFKNDFQFSTNTYSSKNDFNQESYSFNPTPQQATDIFSKFNKYAVGSSE